jgi:hypothetical protein
MSVALFAPSFPIIVELPLYRLYFCHHIYPRYMFVIFQKRRYKEQIVTKQVVEV